jgi:DNA (cytosine-5)-methyltransferase 1
MQIGMFEKEKSNDWKWTFKDYPKEKNGLKVFSCFACGGGSTMGYKLAGCDVLGCCEIDPKMNEVYVKNHNPKYNFLMDIRDFNKLDNLPAELFDLDILDGSPPCTTFSMAGQREESWGKKKKFREGQLEQTLDDLSFVFGDTVAKLKPKFVIMENVEGLIKGEAFTYVQKIYKQFKDMGYRLKHWLLKGETMGVPQTRHRVFFIGVRNDIIFNLDKLDMGFDYEPITYGKIKNNKGHRLGGKMQIALDAAIKTDKTFSDIYMRIENKYKAFGHRLIKNNEVVATVLAGHRDLYDFENKTQISILDIIHAQTFPQDYDFISKTYSSVEYICGMSVPPLMIKRIVKRMIDNGLLQACGKTKRDKV